jgi:hypothetical protein
LTENDFFSPYLCFEDLNQGNSLVDDKDELKIFGLPAFSDILLLASNLFKMVCLSSSQTPPFDQKVIILRF